MLVSATLPPDVLDLSRRFMREPVTRVLLEREQIPAQSIRQFYVAVEAEDKLLVLADLYERISIAQSIVFVNSRRKAEFVAAALNRQGFAVALTHGDLSRDERDAVMRAFRAGAARVLVTTDLVGRGIDVYHVNIVINFELPPAAALDKYVHRIGRCGRCGRRGAAINLLARVDAPLMREIERAYAFTAAELPMNFASLVE